MRRRILVNDALKLLARFGGASGRGIETRETGLFRRARGADGRLHRAHCDGQVEAGLLILLVHVIPPAKGDCGNDSKGCDPRNQFSLMFLAPVDGFPRRLQSGLAETIFLKLMPGFCAHGLPSYLGWLTNTQFNRDFGSVKASPVPIRG